jgi:hypothetical protein
MDYEKISSLAMELQSITSEKIANQKVKNKEEEIKDDEIDDPNDPLFGKDVKLLVKGALILSPIKGKDISQLVVGDKVMISIIGKNEKTADLLKAFNAYKDDGSAKPIVGRIVSIDHTTNYKIHAIVAKGIYVKIVEEENFIKVATDSSYYGMEIASGEDDPKKNKMTILILSGIFILLLVVIMVIVFSIL